MLKKKLAGIVLVGAIVCSVPVAVFAENVQVDTTAASTTKFHPMKQLLVEKAQAFGIATDGKTGQEIKTELKAAATAKQTEHLNAAAAKLGISTDGKTAEQLKTEIQAAITVKLQAEATKLGVSADGKTNKELRAALKAAREAKRSSVVNKRAAKLGISTDGKTTEQVFAEIESALQAKWAKQAAK